MEDIFLLAVEYKGEEREYEAQLLLSGYTHKFRVWVEGMEVHFERDEDGNYRAILPATVTEKEASKLDKELLQAIAEKIKEILK